MPKISLNMEKDIYKFYKNIKSQNDFKEFVKLLQDDLKNNKNQWENNTLELFLEALRGYLYNINEEEEITPDWKMFAELLLAAKIYE